jgi:hypothetical protein
MRFDRRAPSLLSDFQPALGLGEILPKLAAELLLNLHRCLRLAALELGRLSRRALLIECVAALRVLRHADRFALGASSARLGVTRPRGRLVAELPGLLGARPLARGTLFDLPGGGLRGRLGGDGSFGARDRVPGAPLGILGHRQGVALPRFDVAGPLAGGRLQLRDA